MRILIIHQHGSPRASGGAIAACRLQDALRRGGVEATLACQKNPADDPDVVRLPQPGRLDEWLGKITWRLGLNDVHCLSTWKLLEHEAFTSADLVNIHGWHSRFFNYLALPWLSAAKPIVATLHDMWNFTGHCGFSFDCQRWRTGCGSCPYPRNFPPINTDATALEWRLKRWAYSRSKMTVAAPSLDMVEKARASILGRFPVHHVPNAIDVSVYRPMDKRACRRQLGLPEDGRILLFGAAALANHAKGADLLAAALDRFTAGLRQATTLVLLGVGEPALTDRMPLRTHALGYLYTDEEKAVAYNAADVVALPSRAENQSLVMLESMACGTPVVGFDVGGNGELIRTGETGHLAAPEDTSELHAGLAHLLLDEQHRLACSERCREVIMADHTMDRHVQRYLGVYGAACGTSQGTIPLPLAS